MIDAAANRVGRPRLKVLVAEASQALARLDAPRLEELALSCKALNREAPPVSTSDKLSAGDKLTASEREMLVREAREAVGEMAVFARVLEATRGNIRVMNRLRELRMGRLEYGERPAPDNAWSAAKNSDGSGHGKH